MKKKNTSKIKWMLGILIILMPVAYWTNQATNNSSSSVGSHASSQNNFFQFLANLFGIKSQNTSSSQGPNENSPSNQNTADLKKIGSFNPNQANPDSMTAGNLSASQGPNLTQQENTDGNNPGTNAENNTGNNSNDAASQTNTDQGTGSPSDNDSGNNAGNNSNDASQTNADQGTGNPSNNNPGNNLGGSSGGPGECARGCYPGCIPGCDPDCTPPGCTLGVNNPSYLATLNPSGLPTINPIPTDAQVTQSVAQQNQQNNSLAILVTNQQTLAAQVRQSAEATKYQTVTSETIVPTDTTPASQDIVDKIKSAQLIQH